MSTVTTLPREPVISASRAALQPPDPISSTREPGTIAAASIISACSHAADTELVARPPSSRLVTTASRHEYAARAVASGANFCRGTLENAAATAPDRIAPDSRSRSTSSARSRSGDSDDNVSAVMR